MSFHRFATVFSNAICAQFQKEEKKIQKPIYACSPFRNEALKLERRTRRLLGFQDVHSYFSFFLRSQCQNEIIQWSLSTFTFFDLAFYVLHLDSCVQTRSHRYHTCYSQRSSFHPLCRIMAKSQDQKRPESSSFSGIAVP